MYKCTLYLASILLSTSVLSASVRLSGYIAKGVEGIGEGDTGILVVDTEDIGFANLLDIFSSKPNEILETKDDYDFTTTGYEPIASHVTESDFPGSIFASIVLSGGAYINLAPDFGSSISSGDEFVLVVFTNTNTSTSGHDVLIFSEPDWLVPSDGSLITYPNDLTQLDDLSVPSQTYSYPASESTEDSSSRTESAASGDEDLASGSTEDNSSQTESSASGDVDLASESTEDNSSQRESADSGDEESMNSESGSNAWYSDSVDLGNDWRWTHWLGYFNVGVESFIYHSEHKWLYVYKNAFRTNGIYFRDDSMNSILWTSEKVYPFLYRFSDGEWIWYQKGSKDPRWFNKLSKDQWEQH